MGLVAIRENIIEHLMSIEKEEVLNKYQELLMKAELLTRSDESISAVNDGNFVSLDEFKKGNTEWMKNQSTK